MKVHLWINFHVFHIYSNNKHFLDEQPLVSIYHKNARKYFQSCQCLLNLIIFFLGSFLSNSCKTQGLYLYGCGFVKPDKYSSSEISHSSVPLFSSSGALFLSSDFDILMRKLALFSEFVLRFLSLRDILYKQRFDVSDQKKSNNFLF